jgi:hypothetical protein
MANKAYGINGVDYQAIHEQLDVPMYSVRHAVSRGLLDIWSETSIALFTAYSSSGEFRDTVNRTLIAWDDWNAGRPFSEPDMLSMPSGRPMNSLQQAAIGIIWNNPTQSLTHRFKRAMAGDVTALAISEDMERKQEEFRRKRHVKE